MDLEWRKENHDEVAHEHKKVGGAIVLELFGLAAYLAAVFIFGLVFMLHSRRLSYLDWWNGGEPGAGPGAGSGGWSW